ncbi:dynein regulatory complex subunit 4-like [Uloborus diversus]|uniref:dynein regulatory complex subunit 4-like n=1 Tax=Uloborus diversus TaxID=327109 RepID=UPI0024090519|nr:dynein regulatory complex subunit 4-like [Uloborus diversus]
MPPKKQPEKKKELEEEVKGYNIEIMTLDELKQYAHVLEKEIEAFRKHCSFYQKCDDELVQLQRSSKQDLELKEDLILSKDVDLEKLKIDFLAKIREKREWPQYDKLVGSNRRDRQASVTSERLEIEANRHFEEEKRLKEVLRKKDEEFEALKRKTEMVRRQVKEEGQEYIASVKESQKPLLQSCVKSLMTFLVETKEEFEIASETLEKEAEEAKNFAERNFRMACESLKEKIMNTYQDRTRKDLDTINKLQEEIMATERAIEKSKAKLEAQRTNLSQQKGMNKVTTSKRNSAHPIPKFDAEPVKMAIELSNHKKIERLTLENQILEEKIRDVSEKVESLKRQFTSGLKKVRDMAEIKINLLEQKLQQIREDNTSETRSRSLTQESE